jgi:AcrR family transcriptional regulator
MVFYIRGQRIVKQQEKTAQMRARVLDAAVAVLRERGVTGLTLDAVAQAAAVSKGGLLHHFSSKEALVGALLQAMMAEFERSVDAALAAEAQDASAPATGRLLRAYVRASFGEQPLFPALGALLAISLVENPELLALVQADAQGWQARLAADGMAPARAHLIRQAADGAWLDQLIGAAPQTPADRAALLAELLALASPQGAA